MSNISLDKLFNFDELAKVFKHFTVTTGLGVALFSSSGEVLLDNRTVNSLCSFAKGCNKCATSITYGGLKSAEIGEPYIFACGCGLIMCSSPVMFQDKNIGSIVCGPAMLWENDDYAIDELKNNTLQMNISEDILKSCADTTLQLDCVNINSAAQILFVLVGAITRNYSNALKQQAEISRQQAQIGELIAENKTANHGKNDKKEDVEKHLIVAMQLGDTVKAKELLNRLLGEIFSTLSLEVTRIKVYELTAILSRAAVDAGAPLEALKSSIKKSALILSDDTDFEKLCYLTKEILESFIDAVYRYRGKRQPKTHLNKALDYINTNFSQNISLDAVASSIFVSAFYLSHLFRDELNTTFLDYVTKIRIEKAKTLLKTDLSTADIAEQVGYSDASYFSKAFKKETGLSPVQYKKVIQNS